ncbi:M10 family metallopeptidase [Egbenema bharatensis]|uniref:M10 family metallopeptidase n=1 Tax=Egbenema bharatensis TaxID=3463334 RepID=UPI003A8B0AF6
MSEDITANPYYISVLLWPGNARWNKEAPLGTPTALTYSFMESVPAQYKPTADGTWKDEYLDLKDFKPFSAAQRQATRRAFQFYSDVSGLTFTEDPKGAGKIQFGTALPYYDFIWEDWWKTRGTKGVDGRNNEFTGILGWANPPAEEFAGFEGDVWLSNDEYAENDKPFPGTDSFHTLLHEIGHALGLKHPFDQYPTISWSEEDNLKYSIMAYDKHFDYGDRAGAPRSLMLYDIAAIQYLYGANMTTRTGDDIYRWNPDATFLEAIWDAGGNDTISADNQLRDVVINLKAGEFSSIGSNLGGASENVAIAYGVTIENAIGGAGHDLLLGNDADNHLSGNAGDDDLNGFEGDDTLDGGLGSDTMTGGAGNDTYIVDRGSDVIVENAEEGIDWIEASINYELGENLENLRLTGNAVRGAGNELDNVIHGNGLNNTLVGGEGNDTLWGEAGNDKIFGEDGDDVLIGGLGKDWLLGGLGADRFLFNSLSERGDHIKDFSVAERDRIIVSARGFGGKLKAGRLAAQQFVLGARATGGDDRFIYNSANGRLFFDADGSGSSKQALLAILPKGLDLNHRSMTVVA